jgi:uncharacterized membrane protein
MLSVSLRISWLLSFLIPSSSFRSITPLVLHPKHHYPVPSGSCQCSRENGAQLLKPKRLKDRYGPSSSSRVYLTAPGGSFAAASGVLVGSALAGCWAERRVSNTGTICTIAVAAFCSNLSLAPPDHYLYDLCWTTFLPASLVFLLISFQRTDPGTSNVPGDDNSMENVIKSLSVPFLMACVGSIVGCVLSFLICRLYPSLWLNPYAASVAASCLCASFIGGTVNFFGVARIIGNGDVSTLISSMATADTLVMALYFSAMALALKSILLKSLFSSAPIYEELEMSQPKETDRSPNEVQKVSMIRNDPVSQPDRFQHAIRWLAFVCVTTLALGIVAVSSHFERLVSPIIPGAGCAAIALLSSIVQPILSRQQDSLTKQMIRVSSCLSEFCLQLLYASMGVSCQLGRVLLQGPACFLFSLFALSIHIGIAFAGSILAMRWFRVPLLLEDVLIASNAAIGGPATAAAFAGTLKSPRQRGLILAGTFWGVTGYAVGTTIGVALYKILRQMTP